LCDIFRHNTPLFTTANQKSQSKFERTTNLIVELRGKDVQKAGNSWKQPVTGVYKAESQ